MVKVSLEKGILQKKAQEIHKKQSPTFSDESALQQAAVSIEKLKGASKINGTPFLNRGFLKGYYIDVTLGSGKQDKFIAFIFPVINVKVLEFCVNAAKSDAINGIVGFTSNCLVVKQYKI